MCSRSDPLLAASSWASAVQSIVPWAARLLSTRAAGTSSGGSTVEELPNALLGRILALAGLDNGPAVSLVAKRWRAVFFSEPALYSSFWATKPPSEVCSEVRAGAVSSMEQWFAGRYALLHRVAPVVQHFHCSTQWRSRLLWRNGRKACEPPSTAAPLHLADFLALLHPATLTTVSLCFDADSATDVARCVPALQALRAFTRLEHLILRLHRLGTDGLLQLPPAAADQLAQLSQLRSLRLWDCPVPCQQLTQLSSLTSLMLFSGLPADLRGLASMAQLQSVALVYDRIDGPPRFPLPTDFRRLAYFSVSESPYGELYPHPWQVQGARLRECRVELEPQEQSGTVISQPCDPQDAAHTCALSLGHVHELPALQPLVDAMLPAGAKLTALKISMSSSSTATDWECRQLAGVTRLDLSFLHNVSVHHWRAAQALLAQAAAVEELCLSSQSRRDAGPSALEGLDGLTRLRKLQLRWHGDGMPIDAFPPGLQELSLDGSGMARLPPQLVSATALTSLQLHCHSLTAADVDSVLLRMAGLRSLVLCQEVPAALLTHLCEAAPQLQVCNEWGDVWQRDEEERCPSCMHCVVS